MDEEKVLKEIRQKGIDNWNDGKVYEKEKKRELVIENGKIIDGFTLSIEWRSINWWRADGWSNSIKNKLIASGYTIIADHPEDLNILIEWKGVSPPPVKN